jgi:hypothetical protein
VITHSGIGTILSLLERWIHTVVVAPRVSRKEHVDDQQAQIARCTRELGIGCSARYRSATPRRSPRLRASQRHEELRLDEVRVECAVHDRRV